MQFQLMFTAKWNVKETSKSRNLNVQDILICSGKLDGWHEIPKDSLHKRPLIFVIIKVVSLRPRNKIYVVKQKAKQKMYKKGLARGIVLNRENWNQ